LTFTLQNGKIILVYIFKPKEESPMEGQDFHLLFKDCMPIFIALGDEVRLTIIEALARNGLYDSMGNDVSVSSGFTNTKIGMNVKDITEKTNLSRPAVSHHLKILKEAGLISVRQEGTANFYYLTIGDTTKKLCSLGQHMQMLLDRIPEFTDNSGKI
jgi:DNA-binding transcriptional ArsR family regulator